MQVWGRQLRIAVAAGLLVLGVATAASAAPLLIGSFSWVEAPDQTQTFEVSAQTGLDPWPAALTLDDLFVNFTRDGGATGQAYFDGDAGCNGLKIQIGAGDSFQSPGDFVGDCNLFGPLPQDIIAASLSFSYNTLIGTVIVGPLGPAFDNGIATFESQPIFFEPAASPTAPVPEPASLVLLGSGVAGVLARRRRSS